jgi:hypothetical protein
MKVTKFRFRLSTKIKLTKKDFCYSIKPVFESYYSNQNSESFFNYNSKLERLLISTNKPFNLQFRLINKKNLPNLLTKRSFKPLFRNKLEMTFSKNEDQFTNRLANWSSLKAKSIFSLSLSSNSKSLN